MCPASEGQSSSPPNPLPFFVYYATLFFAIFPECSGIFPESAVLSQSLLFLHPADSIVGKDRLRRLQLSLCYFFVSAPAPQLALNKQMINDLLHGHYSPKSEVIQEVYNKPKCLKCPKEKGRQNTLNGFLAPWPIHQVSAQLFPVQLVLYYRRDKTCDMIEAHILKKR